MSETADDLAHGLVPDDATAALLAGRVVAVFASPVAQHLLHFAGHLGWRCVLVEPEATQVGAGLRAGCDAVLARADGPEMDAADIVVTDHHRPELGAVLRDALAGPARWIGVMGSPRHEPPHVPALRGLGVADDEIARVHRPIGLDIGSRTPPEIALSTLAGLLADRHQRPGGHFHRVVATPRGL